MLSLHYTSEGRGKWKLNDKIELVGETLVKPVSGIEEKQFIEALKKQSITLGDAPKPLGDEDVKTMKISERIPDFENLKEVLLADITIDNGLTAASGKLKCSLTFENESWSITKIEKNSGDDFKLALSPNFSQEKIVDAVKNAGLNETVTDASVFSGKGFYVKDNFTKSINIVNKGFDDQKGILSVTAKRENTSGELKTVLSTDYSFKLSYNKLDLASKSKTSVDSISINELSKDFIVSTISGVEVEGGNIFFWFSDNHKITSEEAKTFKNDKTLSKKGLQNVKYVYGSIVYADDGKKSKSIVAIYYLVYDNAKGYSWKLDRIVGEDSPNYKLYIPEPH